MPPNFGIKVILFQNSYLSVYHTATILFQDIRTIPDFLAWVLYNTPTVPLPTHSTVCFFLLSRANLNSRRRHRQSFNPSKSFAPSNPYSSGLPQIQIYFGFDDDHRPCPRGMISNSHSWNVGRYPVFPLSLNSFYPISRKWGTKSWFHQLLLPMFIFLGLRVILIHRISSIKKPTKSPSNSLQWICPLGIPKLPLEIGLKCPRDGEIGSVGYPKKGEDWEVYDLNQCLTLSLSKMERNDSLVISASYFWSNALNAFIFGHGPMTITLTDVYMLIGLRITRSM